MSFCVFGTHPQTSLNHQRERKLGFQGENEIWKKREKFQLNLLHTYFFCSQCFLCVLWTIIHFYQDWRKNLKKSRQSGTPCIRLKSMTLSTIQCNMYMVCLLLIKTVYLYYESHHCHLWKKIIVLVAFTVYILGQ